MKTIFVITALALLSAQAQQPLSVQFSDKSLYNAADHAGSPLGWLETDSSSLSANLSFRTYRLKSDDDKSIVNKSFAVPHLRLSNPGTIVFDLFYSPQIAHSEFGSLKTTLPLNRFGMGIAGGALNGILQAGIKVDMYVGKLSHDSFIENPPLVGTEERFILGSDCVSVHIGSRIHELVGIGFYGGARGFLDSLRSQNPEVNQVRFFSGAFPLFGGFIDVGKTGFPVRSNFSMGGGYNRFVYTYKNGSSSTDAPTIQGDSIGWNWITMADLGGNGLSLSPALQVGYWRSSSERFEPGPDNYPWQKGTAIPQTEQKVSSFGMGMGLDADLFEYVICNLEYGFKNISSENSSSDEKRWYHRTVLNLEGNLHKIDALRIPESMKLMLCAGFFNSFYNLNYDSWQIESEHLQTSQERYLNSVYSDSRVAGFNTGVEASFIDGLFGINAQFYFFNDQLSTRAKGPGFSLDLSCNLQKSE